MTPEDEINFILSGILTIRLMEADDQGSQNTQVYFEGGVSLFYDPPMCHGESHPAPEKEKEDTGVRAAAVLSRRHAGLHMALYREAVRAA